MARDKINKARWNACKIITKKFAGNINQFHAFYLLMTHKNVSNSAHSAIWYNSAPDTEYYFSHFMYFCMIWPSTECLIVGMFQKQLKRVTIYFVRTVLSLPVCLSIWLSVMKSTASTRWIFMRFCMWDFYKLLAYSGLG